MFADSSVPKDFTMSNNKASYIISDALGPYFREIQKKDMEDVYYTLMFDETINSAGMKELQTGVRYWSPSHNKIVSQHLQTFFIDLATSSIVANKLNEAMDNNNLCGSNLLMIGSDGPNVNKSVLRTINEQVKVLRRKPLINIGTCNIHTTHNAFLKGLENGIGVEVSDLVFALNHFFDQRPNRWKDYSDIQKSLSIKSHVFIKHCSSRWLTLEPAAARLLEQWPAVQKYFLEYIPKKVPKLEQVTWYKKIVRILRKPTIYAEILFVCSSAHIFTKVTGFMQKEEPLIHVLYDQLKDLLMTILGRICKQSVLNDKELQFTEQLLSSENLLKLNNVVVEDKILQALAKVTEKDKQFFLKGVQNHYIASAKHIMKKTSLSSTLLKNVTCLQPMERLAETSCSKIVAISKEMPWEIKTDVVLDEWKLLQREVDKTDSHKLPIDQYWNQFFQLKDHFGNPKYPTIKKIIQAVLSLSHGNSDVERGFSASGRTLTGDRSSMSERTLNALMTVKSALRVYENKPFMVPVTKELITLGRLANKNYKAYLDDKKKKEEESAEKERLEKERTKAEEEAKRRMGQKRKEIEDAEKKLKRLRDEEGEKMESASTLLREASERLKKAIIKKDFKEAGLAHAMMEGVSKVQEEASASRLSAQKVQTAVERKKSSLISDFFKKKD